MSPVNGPDHYQEAEVLLARAKNTGLEDDLCTANLIAAAQVHATLALTAATAMAAPVEDELAGFTIEDRDAWYKAAGVRPRRSRGAR